MVFCAAFGCNNRTYPRVGFSNVSQRKFFKFPADSKMRQRWILALKRENFVVTNHTKLCDQHFLPSDFTSSGKRLKSSAVPLGPHVTQMQIEHTIAREQHYQERCRRKEVSVTVRGTAKNQVCD